VKKMGVKMKVQRRRYRRVNVGTQTITGLGRPVKTKNVSLKLITPR